MRYFLEEIQSPEQDVKRLDIFYMEIAYPHKIFILRVNWMGNQLYHPVFFLKLKKSTCVWCDTIVYDDIERWCKNGAFNKMVNG